MRHPKNKPAKRGVSRPSLTAAPAKPKDVTRPTLTDDTDKWVYNEDGMFDSNGDGIFEYDMGAVGDPHDSSGGGGGGWGSDGGGGGNNDGGGGNNNNNNNAGNGPDTSWGDAYPSPTESESNSLPHVSNGGTLPEITVSSPRDTDWSNSDGARPSDSSDRRDSSGPGRDVLGEDGRLRPKNNETTDEYLAREKAWHQKRSEAYYTKKYAHDKDMQESVLQAVRDYYARTNRRDGSYLGLSADEERRAGQRGLDNRKAREAEATKQFEYARSEAKRRGLPDYAHDPDKAPKTRQEYINQILGDPKDYDPLKPNNDNPKVTDQITNPPNIGPKKDNPYSPDEQSFWEKITGNPLYKYGTRLLSLRSIPSAILEFVRWKWGDKIDAWLDNNAREYNTRRNNMTQAERDKEDAEQAEKNRGEGDGGEGVRKEEERRRQEAQVALDKERERVRNITDANDRAREFERVNNRGPRDEGGLTGPSKPGSVYRHSLNGDSWQNEKNRVAQSLTPAGRAWTQPAPAPAPTPQPAPAPTPQPAPEATPLGHLGNPDDYRGPARPSLTGPTPQPAPAPTPQPAPAPTPQPAPAPRPAPAPAPEEEPWTEPDDPNNNAPRRDVPTSTPADLRVEPARPSLTGPTPQPAPAPTPQPAPEATPLGHLGNPDDYRGPARPSLTGPTPQPAPAPTPQPAPAPTPQPAPAPRPAPAPAPEEEPWTEPDDPNNNAPRRDVPTSTPADLRVEPARPSLTGPTPQPAPAPTPQPAPAPTPQPAPAPRPAPAPAPEEEPWTEPDDPNNNAPRRDVPTSTPADLRVEPARPSLTGPTPQPAPAPTPQPAPEATPLGHLGNPDDYRGPARPSLTGPTPQPAPAPTPQPAPAPTDDEQIAHLVRNYGPQRAQLIWRDLQGSKNRPRGLGA